ncbi:MAG: PEP-CTERM sorting domain-containing protein [Caldimonas sp.]
MRTCRLKACTLAILALGASAAGAIPVTISTPYLNLENRAVNSLGFSSGQFLRFGANSVVPNGNAGTTGLGTTTDLVTGQTVSRTIGFDPGPIIPNFFQRLVADSTSLYGSWTLTFTNGPDSSRAIVSLPSGATQAPFVNSITLSGTSANPTFSWAPPPGATVNGYRLNIYDKALINNDPNAGPINTGQVTNVNVLPSVRSYTVNAADFTVPGYSFQLNHSYSIEIGLIQTKDGSSTNLANDNLKAISRVYADFRATQVGGPAVNLPVTLVNGSYQFNIAVVAGQTYFIDPAVATGYDYRIGAGNPNFRSVLLPTGIGDGLYDIYGLNASGPASLLAHDWLGGAVFDFGNLGLDAFRIGGIEASAGLDPADVTAFVTGVTFTADGLFTGTQTPLTVDVAAIPEPETYALMLVGLGALGALRRKRRAR